MAGQANDSERLPWLEPYREPAPVKRQRKAKPAPVAVPTKAPQTPKADKPARGGVPLAAWLVAGIAVVGAAAGGGYWAGNRQSPAEPSAAPTVTIPVAKVDPIPMPDVEAPVPSSPAPLAEGRAPRRAAAVPNRAAPAPRRATTTPPPRPDAAPPVPKVMAIRFSPPPSAGKAGTVVDLGRYLSPALAESAYRTTVGRYPYLGGLTKVVAPQPVVYGQPRLYALQLGGRTPREARQLCTNLKKIGRPCVVR